jgi:hypothetical protein
MRYPYTPITEAKIETIRPTTNKYMEQTIGGNAEMLWPLWKIVWHFLQR